MGWPRDQAPRSASHPAGRPSLVGSQALPPGRRRRDLGSGGHRRRRIQSGARTRRVPNADIGHARGVHRLGQRRPTVVLLRPLAQGPVTRSAISDLRRPVKQRRDPMKLDHRSYFRVFGALSAALLVAYQSHAQPAAYPTVTDDRLEHPDAGDWLMYRRTYDGSRFSPLKQITPSNSLRLTPAWAASTDLLGAHETWPIVNHGRMFNTIPQNNIICFHA